MKTYIILASVGGSIDRADLENIENTHFKSETDFPSKSREVLDKVKFELGIETDENLEVWGLSDFMDLCNDQEFDVGGYFMTYVTID